MNRALNDPFAAFAASGAAMRAHCDRLLEQTAELEAKAVAAYRFTRGLRGAGRLEESEAYGSSQLARLQLDVVRIGAEFEGHASRLLGLVRRSDETLQAFFVRVNDALAACAGQLEMAADIAEGAQVTAGKDTP